MHRQVPLAPTSPELTDKLNSPMLNIDFYCKTISICSTHLLKSMTLFRSMVSGYFLLLIWSISLYLHFSDLLTVMRPLKSFTVCFILLISATCFFSPFTQLVSTGTYESTSFNMFASLYALQIVIHLHHWGKAALFPQWKCNQSRNNQSITR